MRLWLAVAIAVLASACSGGGEPAPTGLTLSLQAEGSVVTVTLTNGTDESARVVRPTVTPNFILFVVADDQDRELRYLGTYPHLRPLGEDGFVDLAPGETTSVEFDLADLYPLESGSYTVTAEYRNPAGGSHEGTSAITFEPGEGLPAGPISVTVP